ncbi:MAG: helix-turn-helix domain-containing protein [Pelobacteraceae bacterium]
MGENWTTKQAAEFLQIKETTLEQWRWNGKSPRFIKMGRCVRYRKADLEAFMNERVYSSTTEAQAAA